ncbi:ankyrin repeat, SAM and basic leucine zipper domain-containing protein 1-like [Liolophura sinensis]|uniref:ankyrin repeat, SAM and basic leucine zipper domain-containing protein 1-like n=1 Tax=Liolophura sinensis TaxID=3198878 RepID=UPI0031593A4B
MALPTWTPAGDENFGDYDGFVLGDDLPDWSSDEPTWTSSDCPGTKANTTRSSDQIGNDAQRPKGGFGVPKKAAHSSKHLKSGSRDGSKKSSKRTGTHSFSRMVTPSVDDLRFCAMKGNVDVLKDCLNEGLHVDTVLKCGWTPLMYAASSAHPEIVKVLLEKGAKANFHQDQFTVLMAGCSTTKQEEECVLECIKLLVDAGADVNAHDRYHMTPLIYAARAGHALVVDYFGQNGVQINKQDSRGWTALSWAVSKNRKKTVQKLIELQADPFKKHSDGQTAADLAFAENFQDFLVFMKDPRAQCEERVAVPTGVLKERPMERNYGLTSTYVKQGELELFLRGLDLSGLTDLFRHHHVDFAGLLLLTEPDLEKIGVKQVGVRKKILDGIQKVHKKDWESGSLPAVQSEKQISYSQSVAMMSNISSHLLYIGCSVAYIRKEISAHPDILDTQDGNGPRVLCQQSIDSMVNLQKLNKEIQSLQKYLNKVLGKGNFQPADLVTKPKARHRGKKLWRRRVVTLGALVFTVSAAVYFRELISETVTNTVIKAQHLWENFDISSQKSA